MTVGLFKDYVSQTRKPEGFLGKLMLNGMKNHTTQQIEAALRAAGFSEVTSDHHPSKPWITVLARK